MFDGRFRTNFEVGFKPIGQKLHQAGIRADHLTLAGVALAGAAAVAIGLGALRGGLVLLALAGLTDVLDGSVAKASGTASPRGAFFDSVCDRLSDALLFGGVAWFLGTRYGGHMPVLPLAVLAGAMLISYERAKAESLGFDARGGLMERAERFVFLGFGLLFDSLLVPVLWVMLAAIAFTAGQRFVKVWRQASVAQPVSTRRLASRQRPRPRRAARRTRRTNDTWASRMRSRRER
jgi:CDP-diacylglycerol--glycerol-3-phosphate 3-phosphatidyltransferase